MMQRFPFFFNAIERVCSPFRLLLLGLVAMLKAAMRVRMRSGSIKMIKVVKE